MTTAALAAVEGLVPFLRAHVAGTAEGDLLAADLTDPDVLAAVVAGGADARGTDDPVVLASLWWQAYAYRTAGTTLAAWVVGGAAPDPAAAAGGGVGIGRGRPASLAVGPGAAELTELDDIVKSLFAGHLDLVAAALRARHRIGARLVWGDAAAAVASCLGAVACAEGAPPGLGARIDEVIVSLPHHLGALGEWIEPHRRYRRATCCLWWKTTTAAGALCEDCSLR